MASAIQVATTRVARAVSEISDRIKVMGVDSDCKVNYQPPEALDGTFADLAIEAVQMEFFRDVLAERCPEIHSEIMDQANFPLDIGLSILTVIRSVRALLLNSDKWNGECMPTLS